jgi:uncharacterized membrane protein YgcG
MRGICLILSIVVKTFLCYLARMRCPYCHSVLDEKAPECPSCQINYPRTLNFMGALPHTQPGIQDAGAILDAGEMRKLESRVETLAVRFPQTHVHVVVQSFSPEHSMELYAFWIFNAGFMADETQKGGENRDFLILLDPVAMKIALMAGYGLEPFVKRESLDQILRGADLLLRRQQWLAALLQIFDDLDELLVVAARQAGEALGLRTEFDPGQFDGTY